MSSSPKDSTPAKAQPQRSERRSVRRCKMKQLMRVRPTDPEREPFDDMRGTQSVSRNGVYFQTSEKTYQVGLRVFVTLPYFHNSPSNREYLAEVVRVEPLANGLSGIGLKLLLELGPRHSYSFDGAVPQK
jgi:PilZ domain